MSKELQIFKLKSWQEVLKILTAYLVACWTFLQFVDWILNRYDISPYWVDILLWFFVGIIPSILIYLFHRDRINNKILKLREKIIFPTNFVLLLIGLYISFGSSDLGSTTKEVTYTDELGNLETQTITKEEFRIGIQIFNFKQKEKDSLYFWMGNTINKLINLDLEQNKTLMPSWATIENTVDKIQNARVFDKFYVDGEYEVKDGVFTITPVLRNSKNGKEIKSQQFSGEDFFALVDEISVFVKDNVGILDETKDNYIDLDIKDITTNSVEALKYWANSQYEEAVKVDPEFTLAFLYNAIRRNKYSHGELEEKYLIDKAYANKAKLPTQIQFEILLYKNIIYNRWEDAEELVKYQLEIEPNNETFNYLLDLIYSETKNIEGYYQHASDRFNRVKNETTAKNYFQSLILKREYEKAIDLIRVYELVAPNSEEVQLIKAYTNLVSGNLPEAKEIYKKIDLLWPKESIYKDEVNKFIQERENKGEAQFDVGQVNDIFRSSASEQEIEYYEKSSNIMVHYKNQLMYPIMAFDSSTLLSLNPGWLGGTKHFFEKDELGQIYRVKVAQFNGKNVTDFYYYRNSKEIQDAVQLLKAGNYQDLEVTFEALIKKYPEHWFLKQMKEHISFVQNKSKSDLEKQFSKIVGEYGNRKFWIDEGRLYYKRDNLTTIQLLPISKTRYINLTKLDTNHEFEFLPKNQVASFAWTYDVVKNSWNKLADPTNYLLKN
ncbi:MAG: hypothetical protein CMB99_08885 [Flavobacteriaceae bacterium]|nr:hypothetical protein [Flavobacteriaceae bacterium]|tara:strand:+ start:562209 stop:564368 length:2160 start_codon:yes stop_codon:yes gene_type:complete